MELTIPEFKIVLRPSPRAKRLSLTVHPDGRVLVTVPRRAGRGQIAQFVAENAEWIQTRIAELSTVDGFYVDVPGGTRDYLRHKERARAHVHELITRVNAHYGYAINRVSIKDLRSRWGSCSELGNLNFTYRLIHIPEHLAEYIVAHEICHLRELNHSDRFWNLVAVAIPDHKKRRKELDRYRL